MGEKIKHISWKSLITLSIMLGIAGMILDFAYEMLKVIIIYTRIGGLYELRYTFLILKIVIIIVPIYMMVLFIVFQINKGDWDMAYLKIIRHKLKDDKYSKLKDAAMRINIEEIKGISKTEETLFNTVKELREWVAENSKGYLEIHGIAVLAKDLVLDRDLDLNTMHFKVSTFLYNGNSLLYNKNILAYENRLTNENNTYDSKIEECAYIKKSLNNRNFDLTIDGKEEIKNGIKKAKFIGISCALICGLFTGMILYEQVYEKYLIEKSTVDKEIDGITILFDREPSIEIIDLIEDNLELIPKEIKNEFVSKKWKIYIKSSELQNDGFFFAIKDTSSIIAYTSTQLKLIVVSDNQLDITGSVIHEFGHFIDSYKFTTTSKFEGFACAFEEYIVFPDRLKEECPLTYEYIDSIVKNIK